MAKNGRLVWALAVVLPFALAPALVSAHGDVAPQPVNTAGLDPLGDPWRESNPYRANKVAIGIGKSAYAQQCARCHGLQGISGGLAPDLRYLPKDAEGDKVFLAPMRKGVFRDGRTLMPKFEGIVSQEGMWAIRAWLDTIYEE
ncbi:MAG: cytochrome c-550 PedF [Myxococcales bacterium]